MNTVRDYIIRLEDVDQRYPDRSGKLFNVLSNTNLKISQGEFVTMVGPTGCGKSTLLKLILGSEQPAHGKVLINDTPIQEPNRNCGIVFQRYALFPHLTVLQNVMFGLELEMFTLLEPWYAFRRCKRKRKEFFEQAEHFLERVGLLVHARKYPHQLSGGMRQRAAIAQALVMKPEVLLMDEDAIPKSGCCS